MASSQLSLMEEIMDDELPLAGAIEALRIELTEAIAQGDGRWLKFAPSPIELTLEAVVKREANGKIGWKLLGLGGSAGKEHTQTLKMTLTPLVKSQQGGYTSEIAIASQMTDEPVIGTRPLETSSD